MTQIASKQGARVGQILFRFVQIQGPEIMEFIETSCDICGSGKSTVLFSKEGFVHVRCDVCGLVYVNPRLIDHLDGQIYSGTAEMGGESLTSSQVKRLTSELRRLEIYRNTNQILEIGPGKGWFLEQAMKLGWEVWAVEVNIKALSRLQQMGIRHVIASSADSFRVPEGHFDVIRMWDVIEHLPSPMRALSLSNRALRSGGLIRLSTTNFASLSRMVNGPEWVYLNGADHITLFEPETILSALKRSGFSRTSIRTRSFNLRKKLYHPEKEFAGPSVFLKPFRKLIDETIRFTKYGHQMIVEAQK